MGTTWGPQAPVSLWLSHSSFDLLPSFSVSSSPGKTIVKFHRIWPLFGTLFLKSQKQAKKRDLTLDTGLIS